MNFCNAKRDWGRTDWRWFLLFAALFSGCAPQQATNTRRTAQSDPTTESWYHDATAQLASLSREAEHLFREDRSDEAAAMITKAQPLINRVLGVPRPTLTAMEAASDLDDLYGRMLLSNRNYGWARLLFQKNLARWKRWKPETEETERRWKLAESEIAECDRHLSE